MSTKRRLAWATACFFFFLLLFVAGGLIPGGTRAAIESWLNLPFSVPPIAHFVLFVVMSLCIHWVWPRLRERQVLAVMLVLGASVELLQVWIPGRTPSLNDFFLDTLGAVLGCLIYFAVKGINTRRTVVFNKEN